MFHNQIQQVQQKINTVQQMVSQMRQTEQTNQQRLQQMAQEEAYAAQQLNKVQQICSECVSNLQSISPGQQGFAGGQTGSYLPSQNYGTTAQYGFGGTSSFNPQISSQQSGLFDPTTMNPDTYQNTMQQFGMGSTQGIGINAPGYGQSYQQQYSPGQTQGFQGQTIATNTPLSNIATMGPDTYLNSQQRLGGSSANLNQIGQQAGVSGGMGTAGTTMGTTMGSNMSGTVMGNRNFSDIATMGPDTYLNAQQRFGGATSSLSQIGQQAGVTNKGYNQ